MSRRRPLIVAVTAVLLAVAALAVAVVVLNGRADGKIAEGVRVGSVDVGGLTEAQARQRVRQELLEPLERPVVVRHDGETWKLTPEQAGIRADVDGMVRDALARSEQGNALERAWREATGGEVDATIPAAISYDESAVRKLVDRVAADVNREPKDATLTYSATSLGEVEGQEGVELRAKALERKVKRAIDRPTAPHRIAARTRTIQPDVTTDELAEQYPVVLTVDRANFKLRLWKNLELVKTYSIAVGQVGLDTPAGLYHIQNKAVDPAWTVPNSDWAGDLAGQVIPGGTPENPLKARWMGIFDGAGIHGTDDVASIGSAASHGCVRMTIPDVIELYDQVPVGAPIYIA
ncbi:MAG TPA: L,D-transpeptidase/peptidoglycan binding protein [Capillimicrobium sp.]|nr:L,D-transpeptidase/peptidoglycan binding protein [Capillimicrobium sp.]